ncbi:MAG: CotH kinase family protein [Oscillospiraceae bacterium]|jgi:hypothetical protein|nr:CotH kinase family protein [Oscillospiraceae bacterium]
MRRSVRRYLAAVLAMLLMAGLFTWADDRGEGRRYHQHLERPGEAELGPCSVCGKDGLCTHLPIISIDTGGVEVPGRPIWYDVLNALDSYVFLEFGNMLYAEFHDRHASEYINEEDGDLHDEFYIHFHDELYRRFFAEHFDDHDGSLYEQFYAEHFVEYHAEFYSQFYNDLEQFNPIINDLGEDFEVFHTAEGGETEIRVSLYTVDNANAWNHIDDAPAHTSEATFRIRGNSSRWFDKPNYRIRLTQQDPLLENPLPLLGMTPGVEWALHGPFLDKTLMRAYVWINLSADIFGYAPSVRFCELILNGEYQGLYVLMETLTVQEGRVDLYRYRDGDPVMSYFVVLDSRTNPLKRADVFSDYTLRFDTGKHVEMLYPGTLRQTEHVRNYITTGISEIEKHLYSLELLQRTEAYERYINTDSFVDFYLFNEFIGDNDTFSNSTYFHQDARGKLTIGPSWDYNNVMNNFFYNLPADEFILARRGWYERLMMDGTFVGRVVSRWRELRRGVLSEENLLRYHTEVEQWLGSAVWRNYEVWGYSFDPDRLNGRTRRRPSNEEMEEGLTLHDVNPSSYSEAMDWMLEYMLERGRWMDENIDALYQYCHPSRYALWEMD